MSLEFDQSAMAMGMWETRVCDTGELWMEGSDAPSVCQVRTWACCCWVPPVLLLLYFIFASSFFFLLHFLPKPSSDWSRVYSPNHNKIISGYNFPPLAPKEAPDNLQAMNRTSPTRQPPFTKCVANSVNTGSSSKAAEFPIKTMKEGSHPEPEANSQALARSSCMACPELSPVPHWKDLIS